MRSLETLTLASRRATENTDITTQTGIPDIEFVQYFNDAARRLQSKILEFTDKPFLNEVLIDVVGNQEAYDLPKDAYYFNRISNLDFSRTGRFEDFYPLRMQTLRERNNVTNPDISKYMLRTGQILLDPKPSDSIIEGLRLNYAQTIPCFDIQRFNVLSVVTAGQTITSLVLENLDALGGDLDDEKLAGMNEDIFMTDIDILGNLKMESIQFDSIDPATGVVTVTPGFTFLTTESIAVGDFVVSGARCTNRFELRKELPNATERYLLSYVNWRILKRDSSQDSTEAKEEFGLIEQDILENYKELTDDVEYPAIIDESFL